MGAVSHLLFLVKRVPEERLIEANLKFNDTTKFCYASVEPITRGVEIALRDKLRKEERKAQFELYSHLSSVEGTRRTAGVVFEAMGHSRLEKKIQLDLFRMTKSGRSRRGGGAPQWHSNRGRSVKPTSLNIQPVDVIEYEGSSLKKIENMTYYLPKSQNQVGFDSFIRVDKILYIFQFTIAPKHPIKPGILSFFPAHLRPPKAEWHFVFVIPPESKISCPQSQDNRLKQWLDGKLYSAVLSPPTYT